MAIAPVDSLKDLSILVEELGEHTEVESIEFGEESDNEDEECIYVRTKGLQNPIILFLRRPESMLEWQKQPLEK